MKVQFIGATHEVTGSCTLLEVNGRYYLVDCGMEQGEDIFQNVPLPVPANAIEAVFLTHAHIDHSGMLPKLCKDGFRGQIYATEATCNLCRIMLMDSAHIQESEAQWRTRKAERAGERAVEPVYDTNDAAAALRLLRPCQYNAAVQAAEGIIIRMTDIGHLLGSAAIEMWLTEGQQTRKIVFSGDVGNVNQPLLRDPQPVAETEYLVIESTYGDRLHPKERGDVVGELAACIQRALDRGGNLVIPAFAVGRTQEMLYAIREIKQRGLVTGHDHFPVYVDSPLAVEATGIFLQCDPTDFDDETRAILKQGVNPIWFDGLKLAVSSDESKLINTDPQPKVILSASGMCEAGRIRHHLKHNLWRKESVILFVGYQAEGSLGWKLENGAKSVKLFGEDIAVNAEIAMLHGTSGHADKEGLLNWLAGFREKPKMVFVNHGDDSSCKAFCATLKSMGYHADAPYSGTEYDLITGKLTTYTEGVKIDRAAAFKGTQRAKQIYEDMVAAAEALLAQRQAYEAAAWPHTAALPGAERLVRSLHALGVPLAVATGSDAASLAAKSAAHQSWFRLFRAVVTASDPAVRRGKPAPDVFQRAAALLGVPPADAGSVLVVEDAVNGVQAALAAGMRVLAVPDPHLLALNRPVFAQADQLLASLEEFDPAFWGLPDFPQC